MDKQQIIASRLKAPLEDFVHQPIDTQGVLLGEMRGAVESILAQLQNEGVIGADFQVDMRSDIQESTAATGIAEIHLRCRLDELLWLDGYVQVNFDTGEVRLSGTSIDDTQK